VNQAVRTSLLAIMPTLDDVDIAPVQRGDQSRGVVILGPGGPSSAAGGHGHGGILVGGGPAGSRGGASAGCRGGATGGSSAVAPSKGKQTRIILDDDEVSSDEDEPPQKRLRQLSGARPVVLDEAVAVDKEAVDKRVTEEAAAKRAVEEAAVKRVAEERATEEVVAKKTTEERATEEAAVKKATEERAVEEAAAKAVDAEAAGAVGGSLAPGQAPSAAGAKRATAPSGSILLAK
jgi:hypothetical protein